MDSDSENIYQENLEYLSSLEDITDDLNLDLEPLASGRFICIRIIWYSKRNLIRLFANDPFVEQM